MIKTGVVLCRTWVSRRRCSWLDQQEPVLDRLWQRPDWSVTSGWNQP